MLRLGACTLLLLGVSACGQPLSNDECLELLDRYTSLLARQRNREASDELVERARLEAREKAATDPHFRQCPAKVSRRQWLCAMAAPSVDEIERCLL